MMEFRRSQWKWIRRETYFELSGRIEKAVEARSTGVKPPTTSTTSVEASITPMEASTTATEAKVELASSCSNPRAYGMLHYLHGRIHYLH